MSKGWRVLAGAILATGAIMAGCASGAKVNQPVKEAEKVSEIKIPQPEVKPAEEVKQVDNKISLQLKFQKGKTYNYKIIRETVSIGVIPMLGEQKSEMCQTIRFSEKVIDVDMNGTATLEMKYNSVQLKLDDPTYGKIDFDSADPADVKELNESEESLQNDFLKTSLVIIGKPITIKINNTGNILEVTGVQQIIDEVLGDDQMLKDNINIEKLNNAIKQLSYFTYLPEQKVAINDSWARSIDISSLIMGMVKSATIKATYVGNETIYNRQCAKVNLEIADITFSEETADMFGEMADVQYKADTGSGNICFDINEGTLVKNESKIWMQMIIKPKGNMGGSRMPNMEVSTNIETNIILNLEE
jgi:hypothetical protein